MIDALIKRVSVTIKCYEMYAHREKKVKPGVNPGGPEERAIPALLVVPVAFL
jgi:nucleoid DNA-binding protein